MATRAEVTGPVNIGNPKELSMLELASMVIDLARTRALFTGPGRRAIRANAAPTFRVPRTYSIGSAALCLA
jgi:hypothetical protein